MQRFPNTVLAKLEKEARDLSSFATTTIEGNRLPLTEVRRILKTNPENLRESEREVINTNNALKDIQGLVNNQKFKLTNKLITDTQRTVVKKLRHTSIGKYRLTPVVVNDPIKRITIYLSPDHQEVTNLMNDLLTFINKNDENIDPLILAGLFHQQFVIIHPFEDGNGRIVRTITTGLLASMGVNILKLFSFENYYNNNVTRYFNKVGMKGDYYDEFKDWDFTPWLEYFTDGIIDELLRVQSLLPSTSSGNDLLQNYHEEIMNFIIRNGKIKDSDYSKLTKRSRGSRLLDFQKLIDLGMIERKGAGRGSYYVLSEIE